MDTGYILASRYIGEYIGPVNLILPSSTKLQQEIHYLHITYKCITYYLHILVLPTYLLPVMPSIIFYSFKLKTVKSGEGEKEGIKIFVCFSPKSVVGKSFIR